MFNKKTVRDIDISSKRVLLRIDLNVPMDDNLNIVDNTRIKLSLPTINYLLSKGAKVIVISHLGRPKNGPEDKYRLTSAALELKKLAGRPVKKFDEIFSEHIFEYVHKKMQPGQIVVLENLRFDPGEKNNDKNFAKKLASLAEIFINDAFGSCHRNHASITGIPSLLPSAAGMLLKKEAETLSLLLENPERPFIAVLGGSKVSDKIKVVKNLLEKVDCMLIGGAMAYTFLKSQGYDIGRSVCEYQYIEHAAEIIKIAVKNNMKFMLPVDVKISKGFSDEAESRNVYIDEIPFSWEGMGIGKETAELYKNEIKKAKTIFWNGPMGVFELKKFAKSTRDIVKAIAENKGVTVAGGGDTIAAIKKSRLYGRFTHISSGGGAAMEFLEGKILPGIAALSDK